MSSEVIPFHTKFTPFEKAWNSPHTVRFPTPDDALQSRTSQGSDADVARNRALAAYKDFLTLWKDADPDIPVLKQAKAEYAKLQ